MKKLKLLICIITVIFLSFSFVGCKYKYINESKFAEEISDEIIRCFDEEDAESLKTMFFANDLPTSNLDKQIKEAFEFYDGPSISYNVPIGAGGGKSMDDGVLTRWDICPDIEDIETDEETTYHIIWHMYIVYNGEETKKMTYLTLFNQDNREEKVTIGKFFD